MTGESLAAGDAILDAAIGRAIRTAAYNEELLRDILELLICSPHAPALVAGLPGSALRELIKVSAKESAAPTGISSMPGRPLGGELKAEMMRLMCEDQDLAQRRNSVVHGYWAVNGANPTEHVTLRSRRNRRDPEIDFWTLDKLAAFHTELADHRAALTRVAVELDAIPTELLVIPVAGAPEDGPPLF